MRILLRFISRAAGGVVETRERIFEGEALTLGRATDQIITLKDPRVELQHARIVRSGARFVLTSRAATGVLVNGVVKREAVLAAGDELVIGANLLRWLEPPPQFDAALSCELVAGADPRRLVEAPLPLTLEQCGVRKSRVSAIAAALVLLATLIVPWLISPAANVLPAATSAGLREAAWLPADTAWSSGALHSAHRMLSAQCEQCHLQAFHRVRDSECLACHAPSLRQHASAERMAQDPHRKHCRDCHREHNEPSTLVQRDERLCAACHAATEPRATDFATDHPQFRLRLAEGRFVALDDAALRDPSGLKFDHAQHLAERGIESPRGIEKLQCADCHAAGPDEARMAPINMERHCERCHSLNFDPRDPERTVPHGPPERVVQSLVEYYAARYLQQYPDVGQRVPPARALRIPGVDLTIAERERLMQRARDAAQIAARDLFTRRVCVTCHEVKQDAAGDWQVERVQLTRHWLPRAHFSHAAHATELTPCGTCHQAGESTRATDVLLPAIDVCRDCHGAEREQRAALVPSGCVTCHQFHMSATTLWSAAR